MTITEWTARNIAARNAYHLAPSTCWITVWPRNHPTPCGEPAVDGLCARHAADKERLS